jgi:type IV secretory pathway VirB4 component
MKKKSSALQSQQQSSSQAHEFNFRYIKKEPGNNMAFGPTGAGKTSFISEYLARVVSKTELGRIRKS